MTGNDVARSDFSTLDAGDLLPGCSIPIAGSNGQANGARHAFREFQPLPFDGLSRSAAIQLADSMTDVAKSLARLHDAGCCYGRITSSAFHNRGTTGQPEATLWIDPERARQTDAVHNGDPESMYWTPERLQSGLPAKPADDWYALGIVLAEIGLSSSAVAKIWELSRQDGKFVERLIKNLKRSRCDRHLKSIAVPLIRQGAAGSVDQETISRLTVGRSARNRTAVFAAMLIMPLALLLIALNMSRSAERQNAGQQELAALQTKADELELQVSQLLAERQVSQAMPQVVHVPEAVTPAPRNNDRADWSAAFADRPLEQVIEQSESFPTTAWRQQLIAMETLPGQKQWRSQDTKLRRLVQIAVDAPWETDRFEQVVQRITDLNEAYAKWSSWARSSKSIEELKTQHGLMPSGAVKEFLGQWLAEALEIRSFEFQVRVLNAGAGNEFLAHDVGFESPSDADSHSWVWQSTEGAGESTELTVDDYHAGETLSFWLRQDSSIPFWDSTVIKHSFASPLLVWQLGKGLKLQDSESGYAIVLSTDNRFGPPVKLETQAGTVEPVVERKVVDPMKELPFGLE